MNHDNSSNITGSLCDAPKLGRGTWDFPSQQGHEPVRPASSPGRKKQNFRNKKNGGKDLTFKMFLQMFDVFLNIFLQRLISSSHCLEISRMAVLWIGRKKVQSSLCEDFSGFALTVGGGNFWSKWGSRPDRFSVDRFSQQHQHRQSRVESPNHGMLRHRSLLFPFLKNRILLHCEALGSGFQCFQDVPRMCPGCAAWDHETSWNHVFPSSWQQVSLVSLVSLSHQQLI